MYDDPTNPAEAVLEPGFQGTFCRRIAVLIAVVMRLVSVGGAMMLRVVWIGYRLQRTFIAFGDQNGQTTLLNLASDHDSVDYSSVKPVKGLSCR